MPLETGIDERTNDAAAAPREVGEPILDIAA